MRNIKHKLLGLAAEVVIIFFVCIGIFHVIYEFLSLRYGLSKLAVTNCSVVFGVLLSILLLKYIKNKGGWI
jgi:hypothetical protein